MKIKLPVLIVSLLLLSLFLVFKVSAKLHEGNKKVFSLPETAVKVADGVYYLGKAKDVKGKEVEGYAFALRKDAKNYPTKLPKAPSCYRFLSKGAKWKAVESYIVYTEGSGLNDESVRSGLFADIAKWEDAADGVLDNSIKDILGGEVMGSVDGADTTAPDDKNEVYFASIADNNTIAMTIVWGIFGGSVQNRELVEWDQVYNTYYPWSLSGENEKMDFNNIATHELGHAVGMDDVYNLSCSDVTMYGYADLGETKKQTLEPADIKGVFELYR